MLRFGALNGNDPRFKKGCEPWNKGKKIDIEPWNKGKKLGASYNRSDIGTEHIDTKGFTDVKVGNPSEWKLKHRVIYEKHHGPIENGYAIIFLDGNKLNTDINNLKAVSRHQLLVLNKNKLIKNDPELTNTGINIANILIKANEVKNRR